MFGGFLSSFFHFLCLFLIFSGRDAFALSERKCAEALLPQEAALGNAVLHRYRFRKTSTLTVVQTLTGLVPIPDEKVSGKILDLNSLAPGDPLPERFLMGDGSSNRVLIGVDLTPGSPLDQSLGAIESEIRRRVGGTPEAVLEFLRAHFNQYMGILGGNGEPMLEWDKALPPAPSWKMDLAPESEEHEPVALGFPLKVHPLEAYLKIKSGYCIQQALTASLLLRRFFIAHRLVAGAASDGLEDHVGHDWILLEDGRIYDLSGGIIVAPQFHTESAPLADYPTSLEDRSWFCLPGYPYSRFRFEYHRYPILALD
jgi:hypothetical protein